MRQDAQRTPAPGRLPGTCTAGVPADRSWFAGWYPTKVMRFSAYTTAQTCDNTGMTNTTRIRRDYQVSCPACSARIGRPCTGKQGEQLHGVHFQRTTALRAATIAAYKALYAPLINYETRSSARCC